MASTYQLKITLRWTRSSASISTKTVIETAVHRDLSDEKEQAEPKQLAIPLS